MIYLSIDTKTAVGDYCTMRSRLHLIVYFYTINYLQWSSENNLQSLDSYKAPYLNSNIDFRLRYDFTQ